MTKQEEIRLGLHRIIEQELLGSVPDRLVKRAIEYLHSQGVVIKVDRELPESPDTDYVIARYDGEIATAEDVALMHLNGIEKGKGLLVKAGYVAVEPLIGT